MIDQDVINALWGKIEAIVFMTREEFERGMENWDVEVMRVEGRVALVSMTCGSEFHLESFGEGVSMTKKMIWDRFNLIIEKHGCVTTRTPIAGADRQHRFNKALGFKAVGEDEFFVHYELTTCQ